MISEQGKGTMFDDVHGEPENDKIAERLTA